MFDLEKDCISCRLSYYFDVPCKGYSSDGFLFVYASAELNGVCFSVRKYSTDSFVQDWSVGISAEPFVNFSGATLRTISNALGSDVSCLSDVRLHLSKRRHMQEAEAVELFERLT